MTSHFSYNCQNIPVCGFQEQYSTSGPNNMYLVYHCPMPAEINTFCNRDICGQFDGLSKSSTIFSPSQGTQAFVSDETMAEIKQKIQVIDLKVRLILDNYLQSTKIIEDWYDKFSDFYTQYQEFHDSSKKFLKVVKRIGEKTNKPLLGQNGYIVDTFKDHMQTMQNNCIDFRAKNAKFKELQKLLKRCRWKNKAFTKDNSDVSKKKFYESWIKFWRYCLQNVDLLSSIFGRDLTHFICNYKEIVEYEDEDIESDAHSDDHSDAYSSD